MSSYPMTRIGFISSCFTSKNGIPRQPSLCPATKATLKIEKSFYTNPEHSLIGLEEFSHIWVLFVFHENGDRCFTKAKIRPPRLNGASVGVFSTRSPHRPSPLGLSLIKLDRIDGCTLHLSGIDLLDGTPVLDIKPYIPQYDTPTDVSSTLLEHPNETEAVSNVTQVDISHDNPHIGNPMSNRVTDTAPKEKIICQSTKSERLPSPDNSDCSVAGYLKEPSNILTVIFTERAAKNLQDFHSAHTHEGLCEDCLEFSYSPTEARQTIVEVLQNDPRSAYRRLKCTDRLYYFYVSSLHVTCWFDGDIVEVLKVKRKCVSVERS